MIAKHTARLLALVGAITLLAAACGSASSPSVASGDVAAASREPAPTTSVASSSSDSSGAAESPLGDLLGIPFTDDDAMEVYFNDLSRRAEAKIAECMLGQGFQYQVVDYSQIDNLATAIDEESREYAEQYGFGITSNPFEESFEAFESFEDPNQEYLESLSDGEREAYQTALSGQLPDFDSSRNPEAFTPSGCQGDAYEELFSFGLVFDQFSNEFEQIEAAYNADPRIVAATSGWSSCMAESGYNFGDADTVESDFQRRYDAIVNDPDAFESDGPTAVRIETSGSEEEVFFGPATLNPAFQQRVDDLAVEERAVATASWDCNSPLREIADEVQVEYEQRFVDQNGAAIRQALGE